jgi:hypothetical protein
MHIMCSWGAPSRGWGAASARYAIEVVGGSKSIDIVESPG